MTWGLEGFGPRTAGPKHGARSGRFGRDSGVWDEHVYENVGVKSQGRRCRVSSSTSIVHKMSRLTGEWESTFIQGNVVLGPDTTRDVLGTTVYPQPVIHRRFNDLPSCLFIYKQLKDLPVYFLPSLLHIHLLQTK